MILAFAGGTQLFVEPQLVGAASLGMVSRSWSPNQLAYYLATHDAQLQLRRPPSRLTCCFVGLMAAALLVFRSKLFEIE